MHIGCLFGTFDPPHNGHVAIAEHMLKAAGLDQVWLVVTPQNPFKQDRAISSDAHRLAMVRLAIGDAPGQVLSRIELERSGPSVTLDTVTAFRDQEPGTEWVLLIGGDQYANLHTWRGWQRLLGLTVLAWTVNAPADIARIMDLGVDGIISDRPDLVRAEMARRGMALPAATPVVP